MIRLENRSAEMEIFVAVVDAGGFSAAANRFQLTPSAISKLISRLEARLAVRLFNRSTRKLQLTPEGQEFYQRCVRILSDIEEAERCASHADVAAGHLSVNVSVPVGMQIILPLLPGFLARHPRVTVDLNLTDEVVNLLDVNAEVAIRSGPMKNSRLTARKLGATHMVVVASPAYLAQYGTPQTPQALQSHNRLGHRFAREINGWPFQQGERQWLLPINGNVQVSNGEALRSLCLQGLGVARLARFLVQQDIANGSLVPLLEAFNPREEEEIHAVYVSQGGLLPNRVRAFIDFLVEKIQLT